MTALEELVVASLWAIVLWRAPSVRQGRKPQALWATLSALATALTVRLPRAIRILEQGTGIPDLTVLLMHLSGIVAIGFLLTWIAEMVSDDRTRLLTPRTNLLLTLTVSTTLATLFFAIDRQLGEDPFLPQQSNSPLVTAYLSIWFAYLGTAMALATGLFTHAFQHSARGFLRAGLGTMAAGCSLGVLYTLFRLLCLAGYRRTGCFAPDVLTEDIAEIMQFTAILTILVGSSLPASETVWRRIGQRRRLRRLRPLWQALTDAVPQVVLGTPPTARDDLLAGKDTDLLLHRRVIEIRDATLVLRAHVSPALHDRTLAAAARTSLTGPRQQALAAALWLHCATRAKLSGTSLPDEPAKDPLHTPPGENEDAWLIHVGAAYRSPSARRLARLLTPTDMPDPGSALEAQGGADLPGAAPVR